MVGERVNALVTTDLHKLQEFVRDYGAERVYASFAGAQAILRSVGIAVRAYEGSKFVDPPVAYVYGASGSLVTVVIVWG